MVKDAGTAAQNQVSDDEVKLKKDINLIKNKNNLTPVVVLANADNKLAATMGERIIDIRALTDLTVARNLVRLDRLRLPQGEAWKEGGEGSLNATIARTIEAAKKAIALAEKEAQAAKAEQDAKAAIAKAANAEKAKATPSKTASATQTKAPNPKEQAEKLYAAKDQPITLTITVPEGAKKARFSLTLGEQELLLDALSIALKSYPEVINRLTVIGDLELLRADGLKSQIINARSKKPKAIAAEEAPAAETRIVPTSEITLGADGKLRLTTYRNKAVLEEDQSVIFWDDAKELITARDAKLNVTGLTAEEIEAKIPEFRKFFQKQRDLVVGNEVAMNDFYTTPGYEPEKANGGVVFVARKNTKGDKITELRLSAEEMHVFLENYQQGRGVLMLTQDNIDFLPYNFLARIADEKGSKPIQKNRLNRAEEVMPLIKQRVAAHKAANKAANKVAIAEKKAEEEVIKNEAIAAVVDTVYQAAQVREEVVEAPAPAAISNTPPTLAEETAATLRKVADALDANPNNPLIDALAATTYSLEEILKAGMQNINNGKVVAAGQEIEKAQTTEIARG